MILIYSEDDFCIFDFASCMSEAMDLVSPLLNNHHKKVAYISYHISVQMGLHDDDIRNIVLAAILHDIGAFTDEERMTIIHSRFNDDIFDDHCIRGYNLIKDFEPLIPAATIIKHHHASYDENATQIPLGSYIVHLADRITVVLDDSQEILDQVPDIIAMIEQHQSKFHPQSIKAIKQLANLEYFWIEALSLPINNTLLDDIKGASQRLSIESLRGFAKVISNFIDYRSRFTSTHSSGVAAVAMELTRLSGFSPRECIMMEIAGFLHDLGKLAVSNDILEKNGALSDEEVNTMRKHTYYTYIILKKIKGLDSIAQWAAYHHEKLNGTGYPFHINGEDISKLSRIMAVADVFTAITEDRPYREGMSAQNAINVLNNMVENNSLDPQIVDLAIKNYEHINKVRKSAQKEAMTQYEAFRVPTLAD